MKKAAEETRRPPRRAWEPLQEIGLRVLDLAGYAPREIVRRLPGPCRSATAVRIKLHRQHETLGRPPASKPPPAADLTLTDILARLRGPAGKPADPTSDT